MIEQHSSSSDDSDYIFALDRKNDHEEKEIRNGNPMDCTENGGEHIYGLNSENFETTVLINGNIVEFMADTGASVNVMNKKMWLNLKTRDKLQPTSARVFAYGSCVPLKLDVVLCLPGLMGRE